LDKEFQFDSILELIRVASEVRIYPVVDLDGEPSVHLPAIANALDQHGIRYSLEPTSYRFQ